MLELLEWLSVVLNILAGFDTPTPSYVAHSTGHVPATSHPILRRTISFVFSVITPFTSADKKIAFNDIPRLLVLRC